MLITSYLCYCVYRSNIKMPTIKPNQTDTGVEGKFSKIYLAFTFLIRLLTSYDFGFTHFCSFKIERFLKLLLIFKSIIISFVCIYFSISTLAPVTSILYVASMVEYLFNSLRLSFIGPNHSFCSFQKRLFCIDSELGIKSYPFTYWLEIKIISVWTFSFIYKLILTFAYCYQSHSFCLKPLVFQIAYFHILSAFDIATILNFFIYYSVYWRMKKLTKIIKNCNNTVIKYQMVYIAMHSYIKNVKKCFDIMVCMQIVDG